MGNEQAKNEAAAVTTTVGSVLTTIGGVCLLITFPIAAPAAAGLISAGVSGTINSGIQCKKVFKDKEEFKFASFTGDVLINGVVGAATGGAGLAFQGAKLPI